MKAILTLTAVIEAGAGLALLVLPSETVGLLLGVSLETPASVTLGRVAGAALLALGLACWLARHDGRSRAAVGLVAAMLLYNTAVALLAYAAIVTGLFGVVLWPGVALHSAMAAWCVACLWIKQRSG